MGKSSLENVIMIEIRDLMKKMSADMTKAIRIDDYFFHSFLNTIWSLVAGKCCPSKSTSVQTRIIFNDTVFLKFR